MPQAGNTMEEGTVISWRVKQGDQISVGQILCEIETDKATIEYESPDAGRLARIVAAVDQPIAVKELIALLADHDTDADAYLTSQGKQSSASPAPQSAPLVTAQSNGATMQTSPTPTAVTATGCVKASPAARKIAKQRGVELGAVGAGSGPGGRILSTDLEGVGGAATAPGTGSGGEIRKPLSKMRRAIGLNLQQSKQTVPHFYVRMTIDADPLLAFYREQKLADELHAQ